MPENHDVIDSEFAACLQSRTDQLSAESLPLMRRQDRNRRKTQPDQFDTLNRHRAESDMPDELHFVQRNQ